MKRFDRSIILSVLIGMILGTIITGSLFYVTVGDELGANVSKGNNEDYTSVNKYEKKIEQNELIDSISKVYDGVVLIENYNSNGQIQGTGTGFFYKMDDKYAYLATNNHVISEANNIQLLYHDGTRVEEVEVIGSDELADIGVLRIDKDLASTILTLGNSDNLTLGQSVFTVGSPLGSEFINTVTDGIVSGINRTISVGNSDMMVLQTTAPINPGNSGGPLLNLEGEVIGINTLKIVEEQVEGMGFSIPINEAMKYISDIEVNGKVSRPTFGVQTYNVEDLTDFARNQYKVPNNIKYGLFIVEVVEGSPAQKAKLQSGDIVIGFNDVVINDINDFRTELYKNKYGDQVEVEIIREGRKMKVNVTLDDSPLP